MWDALLLGLSSGAGCVVTCVPIVLPVLFTEKSAAWRSNALRIGLMLAGRLAGYVAVGFTLGTLGAFARGGFDVAAAAAMERISYGVAGSLMVLAGALHSFPSFAPCRFFLRLFNPGTSAFLIGLVTGLSLCPPFFAAGARVFGQQSSLGGALYFALFFAGTSVYFLPFFGIPALRRFEAHMRVVARLACLLIGSFYIVFYCVLGRAVT